MPEVAIQRFGCDGCGKTYPWKPELTNKKAKCKCGAVITVPDLSAPPPSDDDPPALPDEGIFDFIENAPEVASPRAEAMRAAVAVPVAAPAAKKKSAAAGVLPYRNGPTQRERNREKERMGSIHSPVRDVYVPIALIIGSFVAYFTYLFMSGEATNGSSIVFYGVTMAVLFAVKTVFMIGGAFIVASLASVSFGPFSTAILKLAAVAVTPDIAGELIDATGIPMLGWGVSLMLYWILVAQLFNMGADEAWMVVLLFGVLRWILNMLIALVILGAIFGGNGGGPLGSAAATAMGGAGAGGAVTPSQEAADFDRKVKDWKETESLIEAREYITSKGRMSGALPTVDALYAAGAKNVWFAVSKDINGKTEPFALVGEWPKGQEKRDALVKKMNEHAKATAAAAEKAKPPEEKTAEDKEADESESDEDVIEDDGGRFFEAPVRGM